ncbi:hypothetical protein MVES1_001829 [Malassezia vespertilionis]|uniref:Uncharacterized protein n=1 Tax=Malassezia vespertilionis TaxID=2020962 RepID=A0A2N1JDB8_9BASI|nr:uncharacterized protein MVES1_001829 [Malassezia vespertilionis]PKI84534.1 hypothetical protein MVES_001731 [Malassezia vespertilionis]WFD06484.1 hypothetical protein MVES1_001829 [Malassezia vespertilionis]
MVRALRTLARRRLRSYLEPHRPPALRAQMIPPVCRHAPDVTLPATPETYLALRSSLYELHALPEDTFRSLTDDAGRTGMSGIAANIAEDVLEHRAAHRGSARQQRLLVYLLCMCCDHAHRIPIAAEKVCEIAVQFMHGEGLCSQDALPLHVAAYILRMALSIPNDGAHLGLLLPLFRRLSSEAEYPLLEEGLHLVEYTMQHTSMHPSAVMDMVSQIARVDREQLSEHILQQARGDGFAWRRWARAAAALSDVSAVRGAVDQLQTHAMRISIWSLCCRLWLRQNRARRFASALRQLLAELACADEAVGSRRGEHRSPSASIVRTMLQMHFVHLAGRGSKNAIHVALDTARNFKEAASIAPHVQALVCEKAIALGDLRTAAQLLALFTTASDARSLLHALSASNVLVVLAYLVASAQLPQAHALWAWAKHAVHADEMDTLWPSTLRGRLLAVLARADLYEDARHLYTRWAPLTRIASQHRASIVGAALGQCPPPQDRGLASRILHVLAQRVTLPRFSAHDSAEADDTLLSSTPALMLAMVRGAVQRQDSIGTEIRDAFLQAAPLAQRNHYDLTALAQASFLLRDLPTAVALYHILLAHYKPDDTDLAVLLGGLAELDASHAVSLFLAHAQASPRARSSGNAHLYAALLAKCTAVHNVDAAGAVYRAAVHRGLGAKLGRDACSVLFTQSDDAPVVYVRRALALMREHWIPEPKFVNWMIRSAARGLSLRAAAKGRRAAPAPAPQRRARPAIGAAVRLYCAVATRFGYIDLPTTRFLLYSIAGHAPESDAVHSLRRCVLQLDNAVYAVRWTPQKYGMASYGAMTGSDATESVLIPLLLQIVLAYDALHDERGVWETLAWMRSLIKGDLGQNMAPAPLRNAFAALMKRYTVPEHVPHTKHWWVHSP